MTNARPKKPAKEEITQDETTKVEPVLYDSVVDSEDEEIDLAKAYDWTKKYSYDPAGRTYIRSLPEDTAPNPNDVNTTYVTICPSCDSEMEYGDPDTTYKCQECGEEFKV